MSRRKLLLEALRQGKSGQIKDVYRLIYGYTVTDPGYAERALQAMEQAGQTEAREEYYQWAAAFEREYSAMMKEVAGWYVNELNRRKEAKEREWKQNLQNATIEQLQMMRSSLQR